jgi:hypothetical protein
VEYGIIFWGNSSLSRKAFLLQKKIIRIMTGATPRISCPRLFRTLETLTMPFQYILSLITFLVNNLEYLTFKSSVHEIITRTRVKLYRPKANHTSYQTSVYYATLKTFNALPTNITKQVTNTKHMIANL